MNERGPLLNRAYDLAFQNEKEYGSCPQAVLAAIKDLFGGIPDDLIRAGHGLAGGTALSTEGTCGALSGGVIAISHFFGRPREKFGKERFQRDYDLAGILYEKFQNKYGSPLCKEVQETLMDRAYKIWDPDEYEKFEEQGAHVDKCPSVTGTVAKWTAEILMDNGIRPMEK